MIRSTTNKALLTVLLPVLVIAVFSALLTSATAERVGTHTCFKAANWGPAPDGERPCYVVTRPQEDGSGNLYIGTADRVIAECFIPNVREERSTFDIPCQKFIPN